MLGGKGSMGEVKECAHCKGSGMCKNGWANNRSCKTCLKKGGFDEDSSDVIVCSVCEGKGSVWIGPNLVQMER